MAVVCRWFVWARAREDRERDEKEVPELPTSVHTPGGSISAAVHPPLLA